MGAYTRYRFISHGEPDQLEARALQIRDRFVGRDCWSEFVVRRISGTGLVVVVIDDPCDDIVEAFKQEQWQFGGRV